MASAQAGEVGGFARGRVPREMRQRQVLGLAEELFVERGFQAASMDELARRAGVSKPVVYDLVGSKEQLFNLLIGRAADELEALVASAVVSAGDEVRDQLLAGGLAFFRFVADRRKVWDALLSGSAAPFAEGIDRMRRRQARLIADLLVTGAPGHLDPVLADAGATLLNGAYEALATWWQDHQDVPAETLAGMVADLVVPGLERLRGGLARPAAT